LLLGEPPVKHLLPAFSALAWIALTCCAPGADLPARAADASAVIEVHLPDEGAVVYVNGVKTSSRGTVRLLQTPLLEPGKVHIYGLRAAFRSGDNLVIQDRQVEVQAGRTTSVTFDGNKARTIPLFAPPANDTPELLPPPRRANVDTAELLPPPRRAAQENGQAR
jgi:uncharacterized protein (TIGR03000 family)